VKKIKIQEPKLMSTLLIFPKSDEIEMLEGESILQAAIRANVPMTHMCGGVARCSTCRVKVLEGLEKCLPRNAEEKEVAEILKFPPEIRLACQTRVSGKVKVRQLVTEVEQVDWDAIFIEGIDPCAMGEENQVLIMFGDIQGFTPFAENMLPYDVIYVLNLFFQQVGQVIEKYEGRIDAYMGDGFMALFEKGKPEICGLSAVKAGLEILEAVEGIQSYLEELYHRSFKVRIGLHYGQVVAGKLGFPGNKKLTVVGDAVNLANRIEAANKRAGTQFLVSEETYHLVESQVEVGRMVKLSLPGKSGEYNLYEIKGIIS
jgi:adenylate cyclase